MTSFPPLSKQATIAVVGASTHPHKWGYKVFKALLTQGFRVIPVNPHCDRIDNVACAPDLLSISDRIDLVVFVVPPRVTEQLVRDVIEKKVPQVWMQPGSESRRAIETLTDAGVHVIYNACIVVDGLRTSFSR